MITNPPEMISLEPTATGAIRFDVGIETSDGPVTETTDIEVLDLSGLIEQVDA